MGEITVLDKRFGVYITASEIEDIVKKTAQKLNRELGDKKPLFLAILNGSFMFASDLLKELSFPCEISFLKISSYSGTKTTGKTINLIGLNEDISGRTVVVLEDIIDTGITMKNILADLQAKNPKEIKICTLFYKPEKFEGNYSIDYIGKSIPNEFIIGYGLDYNGYGRNLKEIYQVSE